MFMFKDKNTGKEFAGTNNIWIKRLGLLIIVIGLFPVFAAKYWSEINLIGKWIIIFAITAYVITQVKGFFKSIFKG